MLNLLTLMLKVDEEVRKNRTASFKGLLQRESSKPR